MSQQQLDAQGEAHDALGTAVASYGQRVLSDPHILGNLVTDLLPDLPRERSLLVAGAEAGIAADMTQHVEEQHIDPDTAVQLVARTLSERRAIDPSASMWVASEYAQALGYRVRPYSQSAPTFQPNQPPEVPTMQPQGVQAVPPTMTAMSGPPIVSQPPMATPGQAPQGPPAQSWPPGQSWPPQQGSGGSGGAGGPGGQSGPSWPPPQQQQGPGGPVPSWPPQQGPGGPGGPGGPPRQSWPPMQGGPARPPTSGNNKKRGIIAGGTAAGVVVLFLIIAAVAGIAPFSKSAAPVPKPTPHPSVHSTAPSVTPTPTPSSSLAAGVTPLPQLLPAGIADPTTDCKTLSAPFNWNMPGLAQALQCTDPNLPGGQIYAYQLNSSSNYLTAWQNFNKWWGFDISKAGPNCPPSGGTAQGTYGWNARDFKARAGQVLECGTVGSGSSAAPAYAYSMPTQDAFFVAQGADGSSFTTINNWWSNNSMPVASPSPTSS